MVALPVLIAPLLPGTVPLPAAAVLPSLLVLPGDRLLLRALWLLLLGLLLLLRPLLLSLLGPLGLLLLWPLLLSLLDALLRLRLLLLSPLLLLLLLSPLLLLLQLLLLGPLLLLLLGLLLLLRPLLLRRLLGPLRLRLLLLSPLLLRLRLLRPLLLLLRVLLLCGWPRCLLPFRLGLFLLLFVLRVGRHNRREKQKQGGDTCSSIELHSDQPPLTSLRGVHADGHSVYRGRIGWRSRAPRQRCAFVVRRQQRDAEIRGRTACAGAELAFKGCTFG